MASARRLRASPVPRSHPQELNILLIGKTGCGKSATGNSILQDKKAFKTCNNSTSGTTDVQSSYGSYTTKSKTLYKMKVIDGPGLQDTELNKAQDKRRAFQNIGRVLKECESGIHAFILVVALGVRFTAEDREAVIHLKRVLGEEFLQKYGVIVVTHGDDLDDCDDDDDDEEKQSFQQWCSQQTGVLQEIFRECGHRCVLFNNKTRNKDTQREQLETLLETIEEILRYNKGSSYTTELFQRFAAEHSKLMAEFGFEVVKEEFRQQLSELQKKIRGMKDEDSVDKAMFAQDALLAQVQFEVKETGNPRNLETDLKALCNLFTEIENCQRNKDKDDFKIHCTRANDIIDVMVDRASFPSGANANVCERIRLLFDREYSKRYF